MRYRNPTESASRRARSLRVAALAVFLFAIMPRLASAEGAPAFAGWKSATTAHFRFIFEEASRGEANAFARVADEAWNAVSRAYGTPPEQTDVVITARTDEVNAFAEGISRYIGLFATPPAIPELGYRDDWHRVFFTHELIHVANFAFEGKKDPAANIFGPIANYVADADIETWYLEGLTTVMETELTKGGRGRSPYFELYYKALTLDSAFLSIEEIGAESKAPQGQVYVMGYVLMRSIADRFGLGALADIERNRTGGRTFLESVLFVTGHSADELFRDARIALLKKYARERTIDEGITLTPRREDTYYHKPALVGENGIITLRAGKDDRLMAVSVDPSTREETALFRGSFADEYSLAAAETGLCIAALRTDRYDESPGYVSGTDLYAWDKGHGLTRLTRGSSLFQPALSRDGKRLVAVELADSRYRLVEIDLKTGRRTILYAPQGESCIQPALSLDGSKLAFLALDGTRATLCIADLRSAGLRSAGLRSAGLRSAGLWSAEAMIPSDQVTRAVNATGAIIDIANPSWTADGSLLYSSNARGRLEIWEYADGKNEPVLSDPAGAVWADRTKEGIWYASYAGTGNVIKMKPLDRWGIVPDFDGPSMPGEIVTLGSFASDYPDFKPFAVEQSSEKTDTDADAEGKKKPLLRSGAGAVTETVTELRDERKFINAPKPLMRFPLANYVPLGDNSGAFGFGAFAAYYGYMLQSGAAMPMISLGGDWFPSIGQADAFAFASIPAGANDVIALAYRQLASEAGTGDFIETSKASLSLSVPFSSWSFYEDYLDFAFVAGASFAAGRRDAESFPANARLPYDTGANASAGLDLAFGAEAGFDSAAGGRLSATLIGSAFPSISRDAYASAEADGAIRAGTAKALCELSMRTRWYDLPEDAPLPSTLVNLRGKTLSCLYPSRSIAGAALVFPGQANVRLFGEKLVSAGTNSRGMDTPDNGKPLNLTVDHDWYAGAELEVESGRTQFAFGTVARIGDGSFDASRDLRLYLTLKMDAITITDRY
jgi:hypothetical protein